MKHHSITPTHQTSWQTNATERNDWNVIKIDPSNHHYDKVLEVAAISHDIITSSNRFSRCSLLTKPPPIFFWSVLHLFWLALHRTTMIDSLTWFAIPGVGQKPSTLYMPCPCHGAWYTLFARLYDPPGQQFRPANHRERGEANENNIMIDHLRANEPKTILSTSCRVFQLGGRREIRWCCCSGEIFAARLRIDKELKREDKIAHLRKTV